MNLREEKVGQLLPPFCECCYAPRGQEVQTLQGSVEGDKPSLKGPNGNILRCDYASLEEVVSFRPSVRGSVPSYFRVTNMTTFEGRMSSNDIINNDSMSVDKVVASYEPPRCLFIQK